MNINRKHLDEIQFARAIAIFAVLAVHASSTGVGFTEHSSPAFSIYTFFNYAGKLGTPTFIFLSSFILFYTYYPRKLTLDLFKKFYKKRMLYILVPYLVFSIFYFGIASYMNTTVGVPFVPAEALPNFLKDFFTGDAYFHLYFVFVSVQLYLMFPLILYLFQKSAFIRRFAIPIGIVIQWTWVFANSEIFQVANKGSVSLSYFMFYFFGAFLGVYYEKITAWILNWRKSWPGLAAVFAAYLSMVVLYVSINYLTLTGQASFHSKLHEFAWSTHAFTAAATLFILVHLMRFWNMPRIKNFLTEIGTVSFGFYLIHTLFLLILRQLLPSGDGMLFHAWQLATMVITFFGSWFIVRFFFDFVPHSWIVFGKGNKIFGQVKTGKVYNNNKGY